VTTKLRTRSKGNAILQIERQIQVTQETTEVNPHIPD